MAMSSIDRLIDLARKTGDRLIIHDPYGDRDFVILDIEQYKNLVREKEIVSNSPQKEIVHKVNRDIAAWRSEKVTAEQENAWPLAMQDMQESENSVIENWENPQAIIEKEFKPPTPKVVAFETEEAEADPYNEVTYEIPVEYPPGPLPSTMPIQSVEWEVPASEIEDKTNQTNESYARQKMKEGLAEYVQPVSSIQPRPIQKNHLNSDSFSDVTDEPLSEANGTVFFEEPV